MKCYNCGKEMKELKCAECSIVDYQCDCGWGSGHSHDHSEVIDSKDLGPTLNALYELDVVKQKLAEKDKEIEELKTELEKRDMKIRGFEAQVKEFQYDNRELRKEFNHKAYNFITGQDKEIIEQVKRLTGLSERQIYRKLKRTMARK